MKIDFRKKEQFFKNVNGLNNVYIWKEINGFYGVGVNGTSHHYRVHKNNLLDKVILLINLKN